MDDVVLTPDWVVLFQYRVYWFQRTVGFDLGVLRTSERQLFNYCNRVPVLKLSRVVAIASVLVSKEANTRLFNFARKPDSLLDKLGVSMQVVYA